jgi:hypothetical protein
MNVKTKLDIKGVLKNSQPNMGWGLCIGAGTSYPIFPSWFKLVENLIRNDKTVTDPKRLSNSLLNKFSPDSLIQAIQNQFNLSDAEFATLLTNELYSEIKTQLSNDEWEAVKTIFESRSPHSIKDPIWKTFIKVRERLFNKTSAYTLGKFVSETIINNIPPEVIISFNAESLLYSLIISFEREKYLNKVKKAGEMVLHLDRVTHSISQIKKERIKYVFCHGLLLAPLSKKKGSLLTASDKLVFSENAYLNLASTSFSWQSTEFTSYCLVNTMVFIGVSLTDPNMRRWLSWIQKLKETELAEHGIMSRINANKSFSHYWINKEPDDKDELKWIESCVKHLGVRIIWLKEWAELKDTLKFMIE